MTARSIVKSFLTEAQQHTVRRTINAGKWLYQKPIGICRAQRIDARVPYRPGNRRWRSAIPFDLHFSFQEGTLSYTYRGIPCLKHPIELALYTDLLWNLKPRTIIEIGSKA